MSQNLTLFLPTCSIKFNPPHTEFSWAVRRRGWTPLHSSDQFFIYSLCCYVWLKTHTPLPSLNIIAQEGFNGPCFLLTSETTALTKWLDHLKQRMINVFPARRRGFDDLCHRRLRVELFFQCSGFLHITFFISLLFFLASLVLCLIELFSLSTLAWLLMCCVTNEGWWWLECEPPPPIV